MVGDCGVIRIDLDTADHSVLAIRENRFIQLVYLAKLDPEFAINLTHYAEQSAIDISSPDKKPLHIPKAPTAIHGAKPFPAPAIPLPLDPGVQFVILFAAGIFGLSLEHRTCSNDIALKVQDDSLKAVIIAFQRPRPGSHRIPCRPVCQLAGRIPPRPVIPGSPRRIVIAAAQLLIVSAVQRCLGINDKDQALKYVQISITSVSSPQPL